MTFEQYLEHQKVDFEALDEDQRTRWTEAYHLAQDRAPLARLPAWSMEKFSISPGTSALDLEEGRA